LKREYVGIIGGIIGSSTVIAFAVALTIQNIPQNIVSWILWTILDVLLWIGTVAAGNKKAYLPAAYAFGAFVVTIILFSKGVWGFGISELIAVIGCLLALALWKKLGSRYVIVIATVAMVVAGIPALFDIIQSPNPQSWWMWFGCSLAGLLTAIGAKSWKIEDRFMPVTSFVYNFFMFVLVLVR